MEVIGDTYRHKRIYPIFFFLVILLLDVVLFSGCVEIQTSYIPDTLLTNGWYEHIGFRSTGTQFYGFEQWRTGRYQKQGEYPGYLTITTIKTLVLMDEQTLLDQAQNQLHEILPSSIQLDEGTQQTGERLQILGHQTLYCIYNATDTFYTPNTQIKIISEVWNCPTSGSSVMCTGFISITSTKNNATTFALDEWKYLVNDPYGTIDNATGEGLLYSVYCH